MDLGVRLTASDSLAKAVRDGRSFNESCMTTATSRSGRGRPAEVDALANIEIAVEQSHPALTTAGENSTAA